MAGVDKYVAVMLHFVGPNNGTTFLDNSPVHRIMTAAGNAKISTANFKFNQSSGLFDGDPSTLLTTPATADLWVAAQDFTVDIWVKKTADGLAYVFFGQFDIGVTNTRSIEVTLSSDILQYNFWHDGGLFVQINGTTHLTGTAWHMVSFERYGNTIYGYLDGVVNGSGDVTGLTANNAPGVLGIGSLGNFNGASFIGNLQEFRYSNGIARYKGANFTPPSFPYTNIAGNPQMQSTL